MSTLADIFQMNQELLWFTTIAVDLTFAPEIWGGVLATVLGTMLAGMAVYKREMAQLFKDLET